MADTTTQETILFEVKINSEQYRAEQKLIRDSLGQLVLDIGKTKDAQKALDAARKAGTVADADYAQQAVKLREQLKGQQADQRELEKGLATSQRAYQAAAGSVEQLRASLAEAKTAFYAMSQAERESSEGQALQKKALDISDALSQIEKSVGTASRDVGKYGSAFTTSLAPIVAELAKIEAAQKGVDASSEQGAKLNQQRIGFLTAAQKAAAQAGITDFSQAQATIEQYAQALQPAAENLVRVQQEQQQVGQAAGESSEQYQQLGFRVAGAQKQFDDLVAAQVAAEKASRAGGAAVQGQAAATEMAAGSLAGLRQQLLALQEKRETLDPTTREAQELNTEILTLRTNIQQAEGKIDEFGERVQKNIRKENFDTVTDAVQGLTGAFSVATIVLGDNTDAAAAQAKALQLMTIAQSARSIAIGISSAKEAGLVVLAQARNLFLKEEATLTSAAAVSTEAHAAVAGADAVAIEGQAAAAGLNAEAQAAGAQATAASTVATEAQLVATEGATVAQQALNVALKLNPIGLVIIAVAALVSLFAVYRNGSEATRQKIRDVTEAFLRFSNPIGLVYTGIEKLYDKFEAVRKVLDPVIAGFNAVAGEVVKDARALAEYIGLLDTAAEKAAKLAAAELERAQALREQADAEVKALELAGASARQVTQERLANLEALIAKQRAATDTFTAAHQRELRQAEEKIAAGRELTDKERKFYDERGKNAVALTNLLNEQQTIVNEGVERDRAARQQEAQDVETNAARAAQNLARRLEQQDAAENAQLQRNLSRIALRLAAVQKGTVEELRLQQQQVQAQSALAIKQLRDELAEKTRLRAAYYPTELAALNKASAIELQQFGLTEQQKNELQAKAAQDRIDLDQKYSTRAAKLAVAQIPLLQAQANAEQLKLRADFERQVGAVVLSSQVEVNRAKLAQAKEGSLEQHELAITLLKQEQELAIASLDKRTLSNLEYESKVTAIRADGVAKRKALGEQETQRVIGELQAQQQAAELNQQRLLAGLDEGQQQRVKAGQQYYNEVIRAEGANYSAQVAATKEGTTARENVEKQHAINLKNIEHESSKAQLELVVSKYEKIASIASQSISTISTLQDAASQARLNQLQAEMDKEGVSAARKAVLEKQKTRIEAQAADERRKVAKAEAVVNLAAAVMQILKSPTAPFVEPAASVVRGIEIAAATAAAYAQFRAIDSAKFAQGGVVYGPSHQQGGIQLWHRNGAHLGEMEGEEIILNRGVYRDKRLRAAASALNVAAGGRAFYTDPTPPATWARYAQGGVVSSSAAYLPQVRTGGVVQQMVAGPAIDYDLLAAKLAPAFVAGAQALPPQNLNLTELRDRNQQLNQRDAQTNI